MEEINREWEKILKMIQMNLEQLLAHFSLLEYFLIGANILLLLLSGFILSYIFPEGEDEEVFNSRLKVFRVTCVVVILFVVANGFLRLVADDLWIARVLRVLLIVYLAYLFHFGVKHLIRHRFGSRHGQGGGPSVTYHTRMLSLISAVAISIVALVAIIRTLGFGTWLEAGGVLGVIGVMIALTQGAWVPDLISGLVILNSKLVQEGDVIEFHDGQNKTTGVVFRTKIFYTEILHLVNNHRITLQNSRLRSLTVNNLSRFASAKGLRESISVNVSYEVTEQQILTMFQQAMATAQEDDSIAIEQQYEPEVRAINGGDYAVTWACYYYTKDARNLLRTRQLLLALVLKLAREHEIDLATPDLYQRV